MVFTFPWLSNNLISILQLLTIACLTLHHYSYDLTDVPSLMLCSGTYIGYVVVLSGEIVGEANTTTITTLMSNDRVDSFRSNFQSCHQWLWLVAIITDCVLWQYFKMLVFGQHKDSGSSSLLLYAADIFINNKTST